MTLSYRTRRWLSALILLIGLPLYIVIAVTIMNWLDRPSFLIEMLIYICLGVLWAFPLKYVFKGVGQADPDDTK